MDTPHTVKPALSAPLVAAAALRDGATGVYGEDCLQRLQKLAGLSCPACGREILFEGHRLTCAGNFERFAPCAYAWGNPDAAEADILGNGSQ